MVERDEHWIQAWDFRQSDDSRICDMDLHAISSTNWSTIFKSLISFVTLIWQSYPTYLYLVVVLIILALMLLLYSRIVVIGCPFPGFGSYLFLFLNMLLIVIYTISCPKDVLLRRHKVGKLIRSSYFGTLQISNKHHVWIASSL